MARHAATPTRGYWAKHRMRRTCLLFFGCALARAASNAVHAGENESQWEFDEITSLTDCQAICKADPRCFYFTWDSSLSVCHTKTLGDSSGAPRVKDTATSSVAGSFSCSEAGVAYIGGTFKTVGDGRVVSGELCQALCRANQRCAFWSWDRQLKECYLKSWDPPSSTLKSEPNVDQVSGPKDCASLPAPCKEVDVDYEGQNLTGEARTNVDSAAACGALCKSVTGCMYWTWDSTAKVCYPKDIFAIFKRRETADTVGMISGSKLCGQNRDCPEQNVNYEGHDIARQKAASSVECQRACQRIPGCSFWTYKISSNSCFLKHREALSGRKSDASTEGLVSGPVFCPSNTDCPEFNVEYLDNGLQQYAPVETFEDCSKRCREDPGCFYWTWSAYLQTCTLKNRFAPLTKSQGISSAAKVSGPKQCHVHHKEECYEVGVRYTENAFQKVSSDRLRSVTDCHAQCRITEGCAFWTWEGPTGSCYMANVGAPAKLVPNGSARRMISGPRACPGSTVCEKTETEYGGPVLQQHDSVGSHLECWQLCGGAQGCLFWTYLSDTQKCLHYGSNPLGPFERAHAISGPLECQSGNESPELKYFDNMHSIPVCAHLNVIYDGVLDVPPARTDTAEACQQLCAQDEECVYFSYTPEAHCYLLESSWAWLEPLKKPLTAAVSGPSTCQTSHLLHPSPPSFTLDLEALLADGSLHSKLSNGLSEPGISGDSEQELRTSVSIVQHDSVADVPDWPEVCSVGTSLPSFTISDFAAVGAEFVERDAASLINTRSPQNCQHACNKIPSCRLWEYAVDQRRCMLLTRGSLKVKKNAKSIVGTKSVDLTAHSCQKIVGVRLPGSPRHAASFSVCQEKCNSTEECTYWTFDKADQTCSLMKQAGVRRTEKDRNSISGAKYSVLLEPQRYSNSKVYVGSNSSRLRTETAKKCQESTTFENPFWSWNKVNKTCLTFGAHTWGLSKKKFSWISGYIFAQQEAFIAYPAISKGYNLDTAIVGSYRALVAVDLSDCIDACEEAKCFKAAFTQATDGEANCFLGNSLSRVRVEAGAELYTTPRHLAPFRRARGSGLQSASQGDPPQTLAECIRACNENKECAFWNFNWKNHTCERLRNVQTENVPGRALEWISGSVDLNPKTVQEVVLVDTSFAIPYGTPFESGMKLDCATACASEDECLALGIESVGENSENYKCITGLPTATTPKRGSIIVKYPGKGMDTSFSWEGTQLDRTEASLKECPMQCRLLRDCEAWQFTPPNTCIFYSMVKYALPAPAGDTRVQFTVVGNRRVAPAAVDSLPVTPGEALSPAVSESVFPSRDSHSIAGCARLCDENPSCKRWSATEKSGAISCDLGTGLAKSTTGETSWTGAKSGSFVAFDLELEGDVLQTTPTDSLTLSETVKRSTIIKQAAACAQLCHSHVACAGWMISDACLLFKAPISVKSVRTAGCISGARVSAEEVLLYEMKKGAGLNPRRAMQIPAETARFCEASCRVNAACFFWSWNSNNKQCLHSDSPWHAVLNEDSILVEMPFRFVKAFVNAGVEGTEIERLSHVNGVCACATACTKKPECEAWAVSPFDGCTLYRRLTSSPNTFFGVTGTREAGLLRNCDEDAGFYMVNTDGLLTSRPEAANVDIAMRSCLENGACLGVAVKESAVGTLTKVSRPIEGALTIFVQPPPEQSLT